MKSYAVTFVVQADNDEEANKQAMAFLKTPQEQGVYRPYRPIFFISEDSAGIEPAPHLTMIACKTCGKKLIDDGWVKFCNEDCDDGSFGG